MVKEKIRRLVKSPAVAQIWSWSAGSRLMILAICILTLLSSGCSLATTIATRELIDGAVGHKTGIIRMQACVLALIVVVNLLVDFLSGLLEKRTEAVLLGSLRSSVFSRILKKQYAGLGVFHSGDLVNRFFSDVGIIRAGIMEIPPAVVSMTVSLVGGAIILLSMDWRFVIVLAAGGMVSLILILLYRKPTKRLHKKMREEDGKLHSVIQETLENLRLVKASGSEERAKRKARERQKAFTHALLKKGYFSVYMKNGLGALFQFSWLFCMLWGCRGIYRGTLSYGSLAAIIQLVSHIHMPIAQSASIASQAFSTISSAERVKELTDLPEEEDAEGFSARDHYGEFTGIDFKDLLFSYGREHEPVLKDVNLMIRQGEFTAVTGISGSGKSTLFQLLLGIYRPTRGQVDFCFEVEEGTLREPASARTRSLFAYVPQGNTLFSGTLRENLTMFTDKASEKEILHAVETACIGNLVRELDEGLETVIGERGVGLSEGQAQRVAIARAILSGAPILLLDESTSALADETEAQLLRNLGEMKKDSGRKMTCLIVTHRKAALEICDCRLQVEDGGIRIS